jgi:FAD/FMN-containing dehydrogenase
MSLHAAVDGLRSLPINGTVIFPDDPDFGSLRKPFVGGLADPQPAAVVRCAGPEDVAAALGYARTHGLPIAVRSGGHSFADFSSTDGLLVDVGRMDSIQLDDDIVTVGPGVRLSALAERLAPVGRVLPCGWYPTVSVGGAVLGGGYGMLSRYLGLGCDHLVAAQVVLADGRTVWADERREPDLFWALRGAGWGGFGVVTALVLRTRPAPEVTMFAHRWPWQRAAEVVDAWQDWAPYAPAEVNAELVLHASAFHPDPEVVVFGAVVGRAAQARPIVNEMIRRVDPDGEVDELTELSRRAGAGRFSYAGLPLPTRPLPVPPRPGLRAVKSEFFDRPLPDNAIESLLANFAAERPGQQHRELELVPWGGAIGQVDPTATAFAHRTALFQIGHHGIVTFHADQDQRVAALEWSARSWQTVHPWATGRVYPNYPDRGLVDWPTAYYGENLPRLQRIRSHYDPGDLFRFAQSVPLQAETPAE